MCGLNFGPLTIRKRFILLSSSLFSEYLPRINVSIVLGSSETLDLVGAVHLKLTTEIVIHCTRSKATDNYWAVNLVIKWMLALTDSKMITSRTLWDGRTGAMMIATRTPVATSDDKDYCACRWEGAEETVSHVRLCGWVQTDRCTAAVVDGKGWQENHSPTLWRAQHCWQRLGYFIQDGVNAFAAGDDMVLSKNA